MIPSKCGHDFENSDQLENWSDMAQSIVHLKDLIEYGQQFAAKMGKYMSHEERIEIAGLNAKYDEYYWKFFQKFVRKLRGL